MNPACTCPYWLTAPCEDCPIYPDAVEARSNDAFDRSPEERAIGQAEIAAERRSRAENNREVARAEGY